MGGTSPPPLVPPEGGRQRRSLLQTRVNSRTLTAALRGATSLLGSLFRVRKLRQREGLQRPQVTRLVGRGARGRTRDPAPSPPAVLRALGPHPAVSPLRSVGTAASLHGHVGRLRSWGRSRAAPPPAPRHAVEVLRAQVPPAALAFVLWSHLGFELSLLNYMYQSKQALPSWVFSPFSFQENTLAQHQACSRAPSKSWTYRYMGAWWVGGWIERKDFSCFQRWTLSALWTTGPEKTPQGPPLSLWPHPHAPSFQLLSPTLTVSPVRCSDSAGCLAGPGSNRCHWAVSLPV